MSVVVCQVAIGTNSIPGVMAATATVLRDLLLAAERSTQPLDAAVRRFAEAAAGDARVLTALLDVSPQADPLVLHWPDEVGKGSRWEDRESIALFVELVTKLLHTQAHERREMDAAEALALKIVREKSASLEKMLSWSDKPIVEFRVLELMTTIVSVSASCARELVRIFNFQSTSFVKIAARRMKKAAVAKVEEDDDESPERDGIALSTTTSSTTKPTKTESAAPPAFQIRAAYVRLVAALAACPDRSVHRFALKDGGVVASLFKSLDGDDAEMLAIVANHLETLVMRNDTVDLRGRMAILNNTAVQQLVAVLKSDDEDVAIQASSMLSKLLLGDGALYHVSARQALRQFILKTTANSGLGVDGLEASTTNENSVESANATAKIIRGVISSIGLNDYIRNNQVRGLVFKLLLAYPGLTGEFLGTLGPHLEPKTGYRWFCVASMIQNALSIPLDAIVTDLQSSAAQAGDLATAYTAQTLASRLIMPVNCRKELSRGLQHANNLIIYASLGLIECALRRFQFVQSNLPSEIQRSELESELRFLLPSPETLISLLMKLCAGVDKAALVYLRALTVFRLYLECLPLVMSESKADFTKLLAWQYLEDVDGYTSRAMRGVIVGEILRVLMVVDETRLRYVVTSGTVGNGEVSKLCQLLRIYTSQSAQSGEASRSLARAVLFRVFVALKVFGSSTDVSSPSEEISVWLDNMVTGEDTTTAFVETILHDLLSDPFSFLLTSANESVSPSPATLALIAVMKNSWPLPRSVSKFNELLQNVAVPAFASRVLMALMCQSTEPALVARLLSVVDVYTAEEDGGQRLTKKRRRSDSIDLASITPFQCVVTTAQMILSPTTVLTVKSATSTVGEWKPVKNRQVFEDALLALHAASFVKHFPKIVEDLLRFHLPSQRLHHYIGARPDVDLVELSRVVDAAAKKYKRVGPVMRDLVQTLPLELLSQRILFALCVDSRGEPNTRNVLKLVHQLKARVGPDRLFQSQPRAIVLVAEQLLRCVEIVRNAESTVLLESLSDVLLCLQVHLGASDGGDACELGSRRLYAKIKQAASLSVPSSSKLRALDLVGLSRAAADGVVSDAEWLRLRQAGSTVTTAVMGKYLPVLLRLQILRALLRSQSKMLTQSPLAAHIITTLNDASSADGFNHGARLSRRLWIALAPLEVVGVDKQDFLVLSAGLHVTARLGGVNETSFRDSVPAWALYLHKCIDNESGNPVANFDEFVLFVRRLGAVVRLKDTATGPPSAFEVLIDQVLKSSYSDEHGRLTAVAALLVGTYGSSSAAAVQEYMREGKLLMQAIDGAMQSSSSGLLDHAPLGLIVLRHSVLMHEQHSPSPFPAIQRVLASFKKPICPSPFQLLALLLSLRRGELVHDGWPSEIAVFIVRAAITFALESDAGDESNQRTLQSLHLMLRDLLQQAPPEADVRGVASKVAADVRRLIAMDVPSETGAFSRFVRASRVVTTLFEQEEQSLVKHYSIGEHYKKLTSHALFSASLRDPAMRVELLWVIASMLRVGGTDLYTHTLFQQLLGAYDVSLSLSDRMIRSLLDEFEAKAGIFASHYGYRFGSSCVAVQSQKQDGSVRSDLIEDSAWLFSGGLEPTRIRATIEWFPLYRGVSVKNDAALLLSDVALNDDLEDDCGDVDESSRSIVYDPSYLLPMFARYVASSALPEIATVQQGVLGVALRAVSSNVDDVREYAYAILAHVHESLSADAATDFKPGRQVHLMLDTLRNALQEPLEGVSSAITVFMNDAISILGRPGHTMYPHVNHFLLARPAFDLSDVPMFYSLFNSHSPQTYKQERSWLLHGLRRGVREDADVSLLIRRHVPSILLSFFGSDLADDHTQLLVCNILAAMLKTEAGAQYLLGKCAFLEWLTSRFHEAANATTTPLPILTALCTLLEESLKTTLWDDMDASQHQALGSAAVNCYETLAVSVHNRRATMTATLNAYQARIARLVLQRTAVFCSLSTFSSVFFRDIEEADDSIALDCADAFVAERLLAHHEFQKARFVEWSKLLSRVACILAHELCMASMSEPASAHSGVATLGRNVRATSTLQRLRGLLAEAPSLKLLVLEDLAADLTTCSLIV